jgi:hypothetical protein
LQKSNERHLTHVPNPLFNERSPAPFAPAIAIIDGKAACLVQRLRSLL